MLKPSQALVDAVAAVLAAADADIAARQPVCKASGRCCKFEAYGHRLYVTEAELLHFAAKVASLPPRQGEAVSEPEAASAETPRRVALPVAPAATPTPLLNAAGTPHPGCPYQIAGLCTAREARPLGCRLYFCDPAAQAWQNDVYERYHAQLQALHATHGVPYRYVEWRAGLADLLDRAAEAGR